MEKSGKIRISVTENERVVKAIKGWFETNQSGHAYQVYTALHKQEIDVKINEIYNILENLCRQGKLRKKPLDRGRSDTTIYYL